MLARLLTTAFLVATAAQAAHAQAPAPGAAPAAGAAAPAPAGGAAASPQIDAARREAAIRRLLEEDVRQVLRRYVGDAEFHVQVQVHTTPSGLDKIPYLPAVETAAALAAFTPERLISATDKVDVLISLAKRYKEKTRTKLSQILMLGLGLRKESDSVKFEDLDLELPPQRSDLELSIMRVEADLRDERSKAEQIRKERDDLKMEVVAAKSETDRQARAAQLEAAKHTAAQQAPAAVAAAEKAAKEAAPNPALAHLKDFGVPAVFAIVGLIVAMLLARAFGGIGRGIADAAGAVSQAIETSVANSAAASAPTQAGDAGAGDAARPRAESGAPVEAFQKVLKDLHEDLAGRLNAQTQPFVVRYLTQQLLTVDTIPKAVAAMELFGREHANYLFQSLNQQAQTAVLDFIRTGQYRRSKHELMMEAGEELKTRLLGEAVMQTVSPIGQDITAKLMTFQIEDLAKTLLGMPERIAARMLRYLEPGRIAALLTEVHRTAPAELVRVSETIMKVPEAGDDKDLDRELLTAVNNAAAAKSSDVHKPYLKFYGEILAAVDDQVSEAMFGKFMENPQVATYIRRNTVTFTMFFQVTREIQEEVLTQLSVKDLAALYTGLASAAEKQLVESLLPARRLEAIREEAQQMVTRGNRQVQAAYRQARQAVVTRLQTMQRAGTLEFQEEAQGQTAAPGTAIRPAA